MAETLTVVRKEQPPGEDGIRFSLEMVAKMASEGRLDPQVRAFALRAVRDAGHPDNDLGRARAVWDAMRKQGIRWVPDPVRAEMMQAARHMVPSADGKDDALFVGGDCDDLVILYCALFMAACSSVGVGDGTRETTAVIGHSYGQDRFISHVLAAIYDREKSQWVRVDPSGPWDFGTYREPTRERMILVPSCRLVCDDTVCASGSEAIRPPGHIGPGRFIGINGIEETMSDALAAIPPQQTMLFVSLSDPQLDESDAKSWATVLLGRADALQAELDAANASVDDMMAVMADLGEHPRTYGFSEKWAIAYSMARQGSEKAIAWAHDAVDGKRKVALLPNPKDFAIEPLPADEFRIEVEPSADEDESNFGTIHIVEHDPNENIQFFRTDTVGAITPVQVVVGAVAVAAVIGVAYFAYIQTLQAVQRVSDNAKERAINDRTIQCAEKFDPERCASLVKVIENSQVNVEKARTASKELDYKRERLGVVKIGLIGGALVLGVWGGYVWYRSYQRGGGRSPTPRLLAA